MSLSSLDDPIVSDEEDDQVLSPMCENWLPLYPYTTLPEDDFMLPPCALDFDLVVQKTVSDKVYVIHPPVYRVSQCRCTEHEMCAKHGLSLGVVVVAKSVITLQNECTITGIRTYVFR